MTGPLAKTLKVLFAFMVFMVVVSIATGCASAPLTPEEEAKAEEVKEEIREAKEYSEGVRVDRYKIWYDKCKAKRNSVFNSDWRGMCRTDRATKRLYGCIPDKWNWRWDEEREGPSFGNRTVCVTPGELQDILRRMLGGLR